MISPHGTEHPPRYSRYPPHLSWYPPTVLNTPTVLKISPHGTHDIPPRYWTPPTVLHTHYTGCFWLKSMSWQYQGIFHMLITRELNPRFLPNFQSGINHSTIINLPAKDRLKKVAAIETATDCFWFKSTSSRYQGIFYMLTTRELKPWFRRHFQVGSTTPL